MRGRRFLDVARELVTGPGEAHWRSAAGRAYYAIMLEGREALTGWGLTAPPRTDEHQFVRSRFNVGGMLELVQLGRAINHLVKLRRLADYDLTSLPEFSSDVEAQRALQKAEQALQHLDSLDTDPAKRAAAVAAIRGVFGP
jgi:uncharacterized protein (UPF0332 family)